MQLVSLKGNNKRPQGEHGHTLAETIAKRYGTLGARHEEKARVLYIAEIPAIPAHVLRGYACIVEITLSAHCGVDRVTLHSRGPNQRLRTAETLA